MTKRRIKGIDLKSVGGRIRKARTDASLTIKELSEKAEVSFAYLGMVERDERTPSDKIIASVADATGVPVEWLKNGDGSEDKSKKIGSLQSFQDIDAALFLSLFRCENPSISEETIASFLNVDPSKLKEISAKMVKTDPSWETAFTLLAERLKISETLKKLCDIEFFLERVEVTKIERALPALVEAIATSLSEKFNDEFTCPDQTHDQKFDFDAWMSCRYSGFPAKDFFLTQKSGSIRWNVALYLGLNKSQLGNLLFTATSSAQITCDNAEDVLVFMDEENFRDALSFSNNRKSNDGNYLPKVVAMCIDLDSKSVTGCEKI